MTVIIFDENIDWDKRILCSDESCIGTIGADGKCKECGKTYEGELPEGHETADVLEVAGSGQKNESPTELASDDDWDSRVLCSDGACIGVIGADGKCKECGKPVK